MSDPLIRECDHYVVLEPGQDERVLTAQETLEWLETWLKKMNALPQDLEDQPSIKTAAHKLIDTACDLTIHPGFKVQWFAIRLNPPDS